MRPERDRASCIALALACWLTACSEPPREVAAPEVTAAARADEAWARALAGEPIDICSFSAAGPSGHDFTQAVYGGRMRIEGATTLPQTWMLFAKTRCDGVPVLQVLLRERSGTALRALNRSAVRSGPGEAERSMLHAALREMYAERAGHDPDVESLRACLAFHLEQREAGKLSDRLDDFRRECAARGLAETANINGRTGDALRGDDSGGEQ